MKLSFFHTVNLYGEAVRPICYENREKYNGHSSTLAHLELKKILEDQQSISKDTKKGQSGMCYCFVDPELTYHNTENMRERGVTTDGIQFVDLDHLEGGEADIIYRDFEKYCLALPCIQAISYSFSGNLHIFVKTQKLTASEFNKNLAIIYTAIIKTIKDISGIDVGRENVADDAMFKFAQRFFLCSSPYKWNDNCYEVEFPDITADQIHPLFRKYFKTHNYTTQQTDIEYVATCTSTDKVEYIAHDDRMKLYSSLLHIFPEEQAIEEYKKCMVRMEPGNGHTTEWLCSMQEAQGWKKVRLHIEILEKFGYSLKTKAEENIIKDVERRREMIKKNRKTVIA